jgi:hypothetical protein
MKIEEAVLDKLRQLSQEEQQEMLDFAEFLVQKKSAKKPLKSSAGALAHLNVSISKEEIDEARREMWANFPREQFYSEESQ